MEDVFNKNVCLTGAVQIPANLPSIKSIKSDNDTKAGKYSVKSICVRILHHKIRICTNL